MKRTTRDLLGAGLAGYLAGRGRLHPVRGVLWLMLVSLGVTVLGVALVITYWRLLIVVFIVAVLVAVVRHHRRSQHPRWPTSGPAWGQPSKPPARPPAKAGRSGGALDQAYAKGFNRGQREARKAEGSPTDEDGP